MKAFLLDALGAVVIGALFGVFLARWARGVWW